jgi:trimethylamine--corrinoid protein Co-methyltransferase
LYFHNLGGAPQIFDFPTEKRRPALVQDVRDSTRLLDALDHCHTITPFFTPTDVPGHIMSLAMYRHSLPYSLKAIQGPGVQQPLEVDYVVKMAEVIGKPSEVLTLSLSPVSPLTFPDHACAAIAAIAEKGISFGPLPCPTAGTTAPFSINAAVTQQNAEILASVVLAELVHPGLPIIYCGRLAMMEPRTGISIWGGVELGLASAVTVAVGHYYGFPVNVYGFSTNSHTLDCQDGFERALNAVLPILAGADEISGIGEMEAGVMGSYSQMVIDNEFASSLIRVRQGIKPDQETVNIISHAMSTTRNYLSEKHTIQWLRSGEVNLTKLAERGSWESWISNDKAGIAQRAHNEAMRILQEHIVSPLEPAQEKELDMLLEKATQEISA